MDPDKESEVRRNENLARLSEQLSNMLSPFEPTIMKLQSLLVWEKPVKSSFMFAAVHCIFWFFLYGGFRFYSTVGTVLMVVFFLYTWKKKIWPEIRVPPKSPDTDDWTPVHPRLLSVPELSKHLALVVTYMEQLTVYWASMRHDRPLKFCIESSFLFSAAAVVGYYISGGMLSYIIIMSAILWPCLQYHNLLKKLYMRFEPLFMKLDYSIKVKNKWKYEGDRSPVSTNENTDESGHRTTLECADNESDLEDFLPSDPQLSAVLARAITDSEDEGGPGSSPAQSLPGTLPQQPEQRRGHEHHSDDEDERMDLDTFNSTEDSFGLSIDMMPSFEEALEHTDDEMLDLPSMPSVTASRESSEESMRFNTSHFEDSDNGNGAGDKFVGRKVKTGPRGSSTKRRAGKTTQQGSNAEEFTQDLVSQAISSVMGSMIQNTMMNTLQNLAGNASGSSLSEPRPQKLAGRQAASERHAKSYSDSDDDDDLTMDNSDHGRRDDLKDSSLIPEDAASLNIEDEFDFLDEYDYGSSVEKK